MQITFYLGDLSEADTRGLMQLLSAHLATFAPSTPLPSISEAPQPAVGQNTGSTQPDATPSSGDAAVTEGSVSRTATELSASVPDAAPAKRGPGRPKKAQATDAVVVANNEPGLALESGEFIPAAEIKPAAAPTADDLRAALQKLTSAKGIPAGIELLKTFDCQRISEMAAKDVDTQAKFVAACEVA